MLISNGRKFLRFLINPRVCFIISLLVSLIIGVGPSLLWASDGGNSVIHNFNLRSCKENRCVHLVAEKAESGNFSEIMSLKNVNVTLIVGKKTSHYTAPFGYFDIERNQSVVRVSHAKELSLDISEAQSREFDL